MSRTERREMMMAHVAAYNTSGKSRKNYCAEHGLNLNVMNYWCLKERRQDEPVGFIALEPTTAENMEVHYPNGVRLVLPAGMAIGQVAAYIRLY
jgi:hypothetical protein